ncbi:MAG: ATP-binding protein [Myxococcota bacterium]
MNGSGFQSLMNPLFERRLVMTLLAVLPVVTVLGLGMRESLAPGALPEVSCWILPNGHLIESPAHMGCPLRDGDRIRNIEAQGSPVSVRTAEDIRRTLRADQAVAQVEIERDGQKLWVDLPVTSVGASTRALRLLAALLTAGLLLSVPLLLLWRSRSTAAIPLLILYSAISTVVAAVLAAQRSDVASRIALLGLTFVPAAVAHLAMHFPRRRPILSVVPGLDVLPYGVSLLMVPVGWFALEYNPILWPPFLYFIMVLLAGAWAILILSCAYELYDARSAIALARGRLMLFGAAVAPLAMSLLFWPSADRVSEWAIIYLWCLPVALPLPISLAISRYNLFDLEADLRASVGRLLRLTFSALILSGVLGVGLALADAPVNSRNLLLVFLAALAGAAALEPLRGRVEDFLENALAPQFKAMQTLRAQLTEQLSTPQSEETILRSIGAALSRGVASRSGSFFIRRNDEWRLAYLFGLDPITQTRLAERASARLGDQPWLHLALLEAPGALESQLLDRGTEVIVALETPNEPVGLLLLGSNPEARPYSGVQLNFIAGACGQASWAMRNLWLVEELLESGEQAAMGRAALGVAHELAKQLSWMRRLARKLPEQVDDSDRLLRDAALLIELSEEASGALKDFVDEATQARSTPNADQSLLEIVERTARHVAQEHGEERISLVVEPAARSLVCHPHLGRVIFNLLDNALHASHPSEQVRLFATADPQEGLRIEIVDQGTGVPKALEDRIFEPGFTTRRKRGGSGIGLTVAREILENLGGTLFLNAATPKGTCARIHLPLAHEMAEEEKQRADRPAPEDRDSSGGRGNPLPKTRVGTRTRGSTSTLVLTGPKD